MVNSKLRVYTIGYSCKQGRERKGEGGGKSLGWSTQNSVYDIGVLLQARGRERGRNVTEMIDSKLYDVGMQLQARERERERGRNVIGMVNSVLCV